MQLTLAAAVLAARLAEAFETVPQRLGVALSGGGDSVALLVLLADWAQGRGVSLHAATVDHGLRAESAQEACAAADLAQRFGASHDTLHWQGRTARGNLQDAARRARRGLIADWAKTLEIPAVALGHTLDDQAETLLLRLARGSGVDGLAAMRPVHRARGLVWLRPLLDVSRASLRDELTARDIGWTEDPSNADLRFDRVRARKALATLSALGIDAAGLAATAARMARARAALEHVTQEAARRHCAVVAGDVLIERAGLAALPEEIRDRLLAHALCWVASAEYRPRLKALHRLLEGLDGARPATLHGCRVLVQGPHLRITREARAVAECRAAPGQDWDRRWVVFPSESRALDARGLEVRALGAEGLAQCPDWRETDLPRASLLAAPALWRGATLVAAPVAGLGNGWCARLVHGEEDFFTCTLSH